jgi:SAM-dependent methyltransferase
MNPVVSYYNALAKDYDRDRFGNSYGRYIDRQERQLLNRLLQGITTGVLDLACGSGRLLDFAQYGADASSEMIQVAKSKFPDREIYLADAESLPFANASIDAIISFHFFMHLDAAKAAAVLQECHRVLKPGGRVIFDIPSKKRRKLLNYRAQGWHGALSFTLKELKIAHAGLFATQNTYGLMFLPIHRFPKPVRRFLGRLDSFMARSFLKEYSSYLVVECIKQ